MVSAGVDSDVNRRMLYIITAQQMGQNAIQSGRIDIMSYATKEAVLLIAAINELAEQSQNGIVDFETYAEEERKAAAGGGKSPYANAVVYESQSRRIVLDRLVDDSHSDIIGYYDNVFPGISFRASAEDDDLWIEVEFNDGSSSSITIENGRWYASCY